MKTPKYEPLKMGSKIHADNYGRAWMRYDRKITRKNREIKIRKK